MAFVCPECARSFPAPGFCTEHGSVLADGEGDPLLGELVGSYRIARLIGRGGMGEVYLGVHPEIGSRVAIKLLAIEAALSPMLVDRFFAEARAVNVFRHEGIVNVLDLARLPNGRPYIVMEYLDGAPLSSVLEQRPVPLGGFIQVLLGVLDALGAAHAHGITHRDLKPDNVFVTSAGRTKILDFGIAKLKPEIAKLSDQTRTGALLGTPHYMSPEQARGQAVDPRSDLYSLGVMLYEGTTGQRPFNADNLYDLLRQQIEVTAARPSSLRPDLPAALETVIVRALEKEPGQRYQTCAEFSHALAEAARFVPRESFATLVGRPGRAPTPRVVTPGAPILPTTPGYAATVRGPSLPPRQKSQVSVWIGLAVLGVLAVASATLAGSLLVFRDRGRPVQATPTASADKEDNFAKTGNKSPSGSDSELQRVDATVFFPKALKLVQEKFSDAELQTISVDTPRKDGTVAFDEDGTITYTFKSAKAPQIHAGASCLIWVSLSGGPPTISSPTFGSCMPVSVRPPRCTVAQVVKKAGVSGEGVTVVYGPTPYWQILDDDHDLPRTFGDDC